VQPNSSQFPSRSIANSKGVKCLVTGGAGFIGSDITEELIKAGYDVTVLDDLSGGREENVNQKARFIKGR